MNELSTRIGIRTASPPPTWDAATRVRCRRGAAGGPPAAVSSATAIGSARHLDAFPALLHQVLRNPGHRRAVSEDARVGVQPYVDRVVQHGGLHGVLERRRVIRGVERDGE